LRKRLILSYIGLVVVVLALLEVPLGLLAAHHERGLTVNQAERDANGMAAIASDVVGRQPATELANLVRHYRDITGGEVAVVDASGRLIGTSDPDRDTDDGVSRQGLQLVQAALQGRTSGIYGADEGDPEAIAAAPIVADNRTLGAVLVGIPAEATEDQVHKIWLALGLFGFGTVVLTAVVALLLARSMTRPLARLEQSVADLAGGHLDSRADPLAGPREIRTLSAEFNAMAARLRELIEAQNRFVSDASHQLRSPLTALRLRLENLEAASVGSPSSGRSAEGIAAASREVSRLSRIVDGLLTLGRAGARPEERRVVDVTDVVAERCDAWGPLADERGVALLTDLASGRRTKTRLVAGDLEQILDNLLANALDAVSDGGRVELSVRPTQDRQVEIHVVDDGPGMSEEERSRAFDRFWQGPDAGPGRSGLGLAIVRQLAVRNDAVVELRQAYPAGIDAIVILPYADVAPTSTPTEVVATAPPAVSSGGG
jgi:signal transduction histidine kinase